MLLDRLLRLSRLVLYHFILIVVERLLNLLLNKLTRLNVFRLIKRHWLIFWDNNWNNILVFSRLVNYLLFRLLVLCDCLLRFKLFCRCLLK